MATKNERKIPVNLGLTPRQTAAISADAKRKQVSFADAARRVIDDWIDAHPELLRHAKLYESR